MKKTIIGILVLGICLATLGTASAATYTISWSAVTKYTDGSTISGQSVAYSVYWSTSSSMSSASAIATGVTGTSKTFDPDALGMKAGSAVYIAVKATVGSNPASDYSTVKSWTVPSAATSPTLSSIAINGAASVNEGASSTYTVTATWSNGSNSSVTPTWSLSSTTYASINTSGALTAKSVTADQNITVNASYTSGGITKTASKTVTIKDVPPTLSSIAINGAASVNEGASSTYTATATWSDSSTSSVTPTWSISSTTYASINTSGALTAKSVTADQNITVNASYTSGGITKTASKTVTIKDVPPTLSSIAINGAASVNKGTSSTYTATATWSDNSKSSVSPTWSVSSTTYASINASSGVLTAKSVTTDQTVTVTASYASGSITKTASLKVTVKNVQATLSGITINGAASVDGGTTATYTTTAAWSDGTTSAVSSTWSLSSSTYASINASSGALTAKSVNSDQTVTVTASYTTAGVTQTASRIVTIKNTAATLNSIAINGIPSVNKGASATYTAIASWSDNTTSSVSPAWSLSSTTYASIDSKGMLTVKTNVSSDQTVKITASYTTAGVTKTASKDITIIKKEQTVYPPAYPNNPRLSTKDEEIWKFSWDEVTTYTNGDLLPTNVYVMYQAYWTSDPSFKQASLIELGRPTSDSSVDFQPTPIGMAPGEKVFLMVRAILSGGEKSSLSEYLTWKVFYREPVAPKSGKIGVR